MALPSPNPRLNSSGILTGQTSVQAPQPVHLARSMKRGWLSRVARRWPGSPSTSFNSVRVWTSMLLCRPTSTSLGEMIHMAQSLLGKVLSNWAMVPPMAGPFSTRWT